MSVEPQLFAIFCGLLPQDAAGRPVPRAYRREFDFTNQATGTPIFFDLYKEDADGKMEMVQCAFVDNSANAANLTIEQAEATRHKLIVPPKTQGIFPLLCAKSPRFLISTTQAALVLPIHFINVPLPYDHWTVS